MEIWRSIIGYEGYYEVSNIGRVKSIERKITRNDGVVQVRAGRMCNIRLDKDGYPVVKLSAHGISKYIHVHKLVYESFIGSVPPNQEIDHKDFNRQNNHVENLCAMSHSDNVSKTVRAKRNYTSIQNTSGANNPNYGNKKLHSIYASNKSLSKLKQSRPGATNGRSIHVSLINSGGERIEFGYLTECADYIIAHSGLNKSASYIATLLSRALKRNDKVFMGYELLP